MNVPGKLGLYGLGLAVAFGGALGAGTLVGPLLPTAVTAVTAADPSAEADGSPGAEAPSTGGGIPGGLQVSQDGYTLDLLGAPAEPGTEAELSFRVLGADGDPVTAFAESHGERMHLILVGRDMTGYQHLHPEMDDGGTWSLPVELDGPGAYRVFADFVPEDLGRGLTLGTDLAVAGEYAPSPLPTPAPGTETGGYTVELDGELVPGSTGELAFTVSRDGEPVTDLEPHLDAYGHLVALREGDLAYLHVHPGERPGDGAAEPGPRIVFQAEAPSPGDYRLFLDFRHEGRVRTAEFTVSVGADAGAERGNEAGSGDGDGDGGGAEGEADHSH
ncbi:hypothetical protein [Nocardiopsis sp. FR26]|uniref:hypothetical protein n=1 Tax=Nocardiopsis sp. FR26 TaxID=2605987 RepID=UPI001357C439|nr:hypothetical protein [Nocardiopsis sp. FR26]